MSKNLLSVFTVCVVMVLLSTFGDAQVKVQDSSVKNLYVISAKAGGVNYVEGKVSNARANGRSGLLLKSDTVEVGDKISTGINGKAEILLNPGSYIRLAENTNFEFETTSLDDLQLNISRGSAMIEAITTDEFKVAVNTPKGRFFVVKSGVYRIDVANDGAGRVGVWKGKVQIDNFDSTEIKGGRAAIIDGGQVEVVKFDRDEKDALETWSKVRAKELAKVNSRLQQSRDIRNSLLSSFNRRGWSLYDSYGLWVRDSFSSSYCFLPFGYGWSSPYGYGFGRDIWHYRLPTYIYQQPTPIVNNGGGRTLITKNLGIGTPGGEASSDASPPFHRIQRETRTYPVEQNTEFSPSFSIPNRQSSAPVYIPSTSMPINKGGIKTPQ
ncbi:MAG: FecR family protein [Acidobacteriota bacterium]|nr:FecR family protein [Acidobacteriota bacterium]